jgi:hypothetical protein
MFEGPQRDDWFWKFREGSAFAWIAIVLIFLGFFYVVASWYYSVEQPLKFTSFQERIAAPPLLK